MHAKTQASAGVLFLLSMNAYIVYSDNIDELVRQWRASLLRDDSVNGLIKLKARPERKRFNPLAEEEAIKEDASHPD